MTKKRKTTSDLVFKSKPQLARAVLAATLGFVVAVALGEVAGVQAATITVNQDGSGDYTDIPPAVFAAAPGDTIMVAPGEYTGADLYFVSSGIKVIGSGPDTRIVRPCFEFLGFKFGCYVGVADAEISNLAIELENVVNTDFVYGVCIEYAPDIGSFAVDATVKDVKITVATYGISAFGTERPRIEGNTIVVEAADIGILCSNSPNPVVTDNDISGIVEAANSGIYCYNSPNPVITDNDISGIYAWDCILSNYSPNAVITGNTMTSEAAYRGIEVFYSPNPEISGNTISGTYRNIALICSGSNEIDILNPIITGNTISGTYEAHGIYLQRALNADIAGNTISGIGGRGGIFVIWSNFAIVEENAIQNFRTEKASAAPIMVQMSQNCTLTQNTLIDVYDHVNFVHDKGPIAGVNISGYGTWLDPCVNNTVQDNDYSQSGLPGFKASAAGFINPGCVLLEAGWWGSDYGEALGNTVDEDLFPVLDPHQSDVCNQVVDLTLGSNTVIGLEDCDSQAYSHLVNMLMQYQRMEELGVEHYEELSNFPYDNWPARP